MTMRVLVIANPVSGRERTSTIVRQFVACVKKRGHTVEVKFTNEPHDASQIASRISPEFDRLLIAGGDGTINEVLNAADSDRLPPILVLPTGTANILARELSLPRGVTRLARLMENGQVRNIDIGLVNERKFLMLVSSGFDALVTRHIKANRPQRLGFRGYLNPIVSALKVYDPLDLKVTLDFNQEILGKLVIVQKATRYGGIFRFSNRASLTSGEFEVCVFPKGSVFDLVRYALIGIIGLKACSENIYTYMAKNVRIDSVSPSPVEVDGDYFGQTPVNISLSGKHLKVVTSCS